MVSVRGPFARCSGMIGAGIGLYYYFGYRGIWDKCADISDISEFGARISDALIFRCSLVTVRHRKQLKEPIAWASLIVMNTQEQLWDTCIELQSGQFPLIRVDWDFTCIATKLADA
eukprot:scaffold110730_cov59-Attheya_sp.AAC.7